MRKLANESNSTVFTPHDSHHMIHFTPHDSHHMIQFTPHDSVHTTWFTPHDSVHTTWFTPHDSVMYKRIETKQYYCKNLFYFFYFYYITMYISIVCKDVNLQN